MCGVFGDLVLSKVLFNNDRKLVWPFPGLRVGEGIPDDAVKPPVHLTQVGIFVPASCVPPAVAPNLLQRVKHQACSCVGIWPRFMSWRDAVHRPCVHAQVYLSAALLSNPDKLNRTSMVMIGFFRNRCGLDTPSKRFRDDRKFACFSEQFVRPPCSVSPNLHSFLSSLFGYT